MSLEALDKIKKGELDFDFQEETEKIGGPLLTPVDEGLVFDVEEKEHIHKYWLSSYAKKRIMDNQNYIILIVGPTGSGKSYTAIELARDIDPTFTAERIVFSPVDFIKLTKSGLEPGSVILWDEVGVAVSSRDWWTIQNKMIAFILETFRRDRVILIMTTPNISFIDKKIRALIHGFAETIDKTFTGKFGFVKYFHIVVNLREGRMMYRYPRIRDKYGRIRVIQAKSSLSGNMKFNKPPEELTIPYEMKKVGFTENIKDEALELATMDGTKSAKIDVTQMIEIIKENAKDFGLYDESPLSKIINKVYVKMCLKFPDQNISKSKIDSVIKYLMDDMGIEEKDNMILDDSMINLVKEAYKSNTDIRGVANMLGRDKDILKKTIKDWKKRGLWSGDF